MLYGFIVKKFVIIYAASDACRIFYSLTKMQTTLTNPYLHWNKTSLKSELKRLKNLRIAYLREGVDSKDFQNLVSNIKAVEQALEQ